MSGAIVAGIGRLLDVSGHWMAWNTVLALAPWALSLYLFRPARRPGPGWICGNCDALRRFTRYTTARGWARSPWAVELPIHALSAVAIYVGRVHRFNSWDVVQEPANVIVHAVVGFTRPLALAGIVVMFTCLALGQAVIRIALAGRQRYPA